MHWNTVPPSLEIPFINTDVFLFFDCCALQNNDFKRMAAAPMLLCFY